MPPLSQMVPVTSVETVSTHAIKMGWMEKEAEESYFGAGWHKKFVVLTGWEEGEAHMFYYDKDTSAEATGILFVNDVTPDEEGKGDAKVLTLQGTQRRFRFRCTSEGDARSWRKALLEAKLNGGHKCKCSVAATAWMAEKHAKTCDNCRQLFTASNRKHHCRCCGRIFCNVCSNANKINLEPFPIPVRCCNRCNETQLRLVKEAAERAERARVFVAKHLSLLEDGGNFECLNRSDIIRNLALDHNTGMSLQYRNLLIIESMHPDAAARMAARTLEDSKSSISRIKAATMRVGESIAAIRPSLLVEVFKPEQAQKNMHAMQDKAMLQMQKFKDVEGNLQSLADGFTTLVEGHRNFQIEVRHIKGVLDYAQNPTIVEKFPSVANRSLGIQISNAPVPLELVCATAEEKCLWVLALTEMAALSEDVGTEILLVQKNSANMQAAVQKKLEQRKQDRQSAVMDGVKSSTMR